MKRQILNLIVAVAAIGLAGCQNPDGTQNNTGSGALMGGAMGAVTGAAIGGSQHGGEDALMGAAAGALAGGLIGNSMDQQQRARLREQSPQTYARVDQGQPLSVADVKALAIAGISEEVIINQIKSSRTIYRLSTTDIIDLRDAGVTDKVVNYMINTPSTAGAAAPASTMIVRQAPPPPPAASVVVAAPGPGCVWISGDYDWNGVSWVWIGGHWAYRTFLA
jgi:outer membrane lipoprotein SlyB